MTATTVRLATITSGTLASSFIGGTSTIDGFTLITGDYILIKNQTNATENGVYVVTAGTPTRLLSFRNGLAISESIIYVVQGNMNGFTQWTCTNLSPNDIVGTNALTFTNTVVKDPVDLSSTQTLTNKTITDSTNNVVANGFRSATTIVDVSGSTAPTAGQLLIATSATSAVWQTVTDIISPIIVSSSTQTNSTSTTFVLVENMTSTPGAGEYSISFSSSISIDAEATAQYQIFVNGTPITDSLRRFGVNNSSKNIISTIYTQTITTVLDAEAIEIRALTSAGTMSIYERSMILVKL